MEWNNFLKPRMKLTTGIAWSSIMLTPLSIKFLRSSLKSIIYFTFNGLIVFGLAVNSSFADKQIQNMNSSEHQATSDVVANDENTQLNLSQRDRSESDRDRDKKRDEENNQKEKQHKNKDKEFFKKWF